MDIERSGENMIYFKKCGECGRVLPLWRNDSLICCGNPMQEIKPNSTDASHEKHIPSYEIKGNTIYVKVNHIMELDHHINWLMLVSENEIYFKNLENETEATAEFTYKPNSKLYAYCNLHGLWTCVVD